MALPELLTPKELAEMLKISKAGVYRLIGRGIIPYHKVIRSIRFDKKDVLAYLEENKVDAMIVKRRYGKTMW